MPWWVRRAKVAIVLQQQHRRRSQLSRGSAAAAAAAAEAAAAAAAAGRSSLVVELLEAHWDLIRAVYTLERQVHEYRPVGEFHDVPAHQILEAQPSDLKR